MEAFLGFLTLLVMAWCLVGLVSPSKAMFWAKKRTRWRVFGWFILVSFVIGTAIQIFVPQPPKPQVEKVAKAGNEDALNRAATEAEEGRKQAEANREKIVKQTEAGLAELASPSLDAAKGQKTDQAKATVRRVVIELVAMDKAGSDAAGVAGHLAQSVGKGVSLGDVYGAMKAAKVASDDSFTRLMRYTVPDNLPKVAHDKLQEAIAAFRRAAMLRGDIAESFMEWLDTRKPSLDHAIHEKSGQVTTAMVIAITSVMEAMKAAGYNDEEVKAMLADMGGKQQAAPDKPRRKKK